MKKNESGVSPVIATILMVAITVVLAATVYIMVSGYTGYQQQEISGNLVYMSSMSNRTSGHVVFQIVLNTPSVPTVNAVHIKVLDKSGNPVSNFSYNWTHTASDSTHIKSGDYLAIDIPGQDLTGYTVIVSFDQYTGTIQGTVPPS